MLRKWDSVKEGEVVSTSQKHEASIVKLTLLFTILFFNSFNAQVVVFDVLSFNVQSSC